MYVAGLSCAFLLVSRCFSFKFQPFNLSKIEFPQLFIPARVSHKPDDIVAVKKECLETETTKIRETPNESRSDFSSPQSGRVFI